MDKKNLIYLGDFYGLSNLNKITRIKDGIENEVYDLVSERGRFILKCYLYRSVEDVEFELRIFDTLANNCNLFKFPTPIRGKNNARIFEIEKRPVIVYPYLEGIKPKYTNLPLITKLNDLAFELHQNLVKCLFDEKIKNFRIDRIYKMSESIFDIASSIKNVEVENVITNELKYYRKYYLLLQKFEKILIHGDLNASNVLLNYNGSISAVIDFDDAYIDSMIVEFTTIARSFCFDENKKLKIERVGHLIDQFNKNNKCEKILLSDFLLLIKYTCFKFFVYILYNDMFLRQKDIKNCFYKINNDFYKLKYLQDTI